MADNDYDLKIGADASSATAEFNKLTTTAAEASAKIQQVMREASYNMASAVSESTEKMKSEFEKITGVIGKMQGAMIAFAAVAAGGEAFASAIEASVGMTKSAMGLSKALGITTSEASVLNVALDDVYLSTDTMQTANAKLTKTLGTNEKAFADLGVATRDANGDFRSSLDIMLDTNQHLLTFKEGIDRNIEGQKIYGKSWSEVSGILRLTTAGMEESRQKAAELGVIIGQENVEATAKYRAAMNDVGDVLEAVKKTIGDALLPIVTQLGEWFADIGPAAVIVFKGAIGGVASMLQGLMLVFKITWTLLSTGFKNMMDIGGAFGRVMHDVLHGDFSGAASDARVGMKALQENSAAAFDQIAKDAQETKDKIYNLFATPTATTAKGEGAHSDGKDSKDSKTKADPSHIADWKEQLTQQLEADQNYFKDSLQAELDFWNAKLALTKKGSKDRQAVEQELYNLHKKQAQDALANDIADFKAQSDAAQAGGVERIRIAGQIAVEIGEKYGLESKEYKAALADMQKAALEHQKQLDKLADMHLERVKSHQLAELELDRQRITDQQALGEITAMQSLQALQKLTEDEYQIERKAAQDSADLINNDVIAKQQAYDKIAALAETHRLDMAKISGKMALEQKRTWDKTFAPISTAFEKTVSGIIQGTVTLKQGLSNLFKSIALEFVNMGVNMVVEWASKQAMKLLITTTTAAQETATQAAAAATQAGTQKTLGVGGVMSNAAIAATAAMASVAAIPFYGWAMAPEVGAATYGLAMGYMASAEGGYDIPAGVNPVTQLHEKEMVLPKAQAEAVRSMADGGGMGGDIHLHVTAMDSKDVARLFKDNGHHLAAALKQQVRNFNTGR